MSDDTKADDELQAWREVHQHLSKAILVAKEAVDVAKAQRRYYLEELCANVSPEGKLVSTSAWKKAGKATRKKRKAPSDCSAVKLKRKAEENNTFWQTGPHPILPNDGMALAHMYAANDPNNNAAQHPPLTPMQAAQSGGAAGFPPAVCIE